MEDIADAVIFWKTSSKSIFVDEHATDFTENVINTKDVEDSMRTLKEILSEYLALKKVEGVSFEVIRRVVTTEEEGAAISFIRAFGNDINDALINELKDIAEISLHYLYETNNLSFKLDSNNLPKIAPEIVDVIDNNLAKNQHYGIKTAFNISTDLGRLKHECVIGYSNRTLVNADFESQDISGLGKAVGFNEQKNLLLIRPVTQNQLVKNILTFYFEPAQVDLIRVACLSRVEEKLLSYSAKTQKNQQQRIINFITAAELVDLESAENFELIDQ